MQPEDVVAPADTSLLNEWIDYKPNADRVRNKTICRWYKDL